MAGEDGQPAVLRFFALSLVGFPLRSYGASQGTTSSMQRRVSFVSYIRGTPQIRGQPVRRAMAAPKPSSTLHTVTPEARLVSVQPESPTASHPWRLLLVIEHRPLVEQQATHLGHDAEGAGRSHLALLAS